MKIIYKLHARQGKVWQSKSRFRVLVAGRRFGKTTLAVNELFQNAILSEGSLNFYIAPTYKQAKMIAWQMINEIIPDEMVNKKNESELEIKLNNKSRICLKGADNEDSLRGVGVDYAVLDEYAMMKVNVWSEIVRPMLMDTNGRALFIGTPKGQNHFYDLYVKGVDSIDGFESFMFTSYDNPYIDPKEIDAMKDELHESVFNQEVMCSFLVSEDNVLIKLQDIEALKGVQMYYDKTVKVVSCDPATGGDECVMYVLENNKIVDAKYVYYRDSMKIADDILTLMVKYKIAWCGIDSVGIGKTLSDHLSRLVKGQNKHVLPISSGEKATEETRFANKRTEIWWYLYELIMQQKIAYIHDYELRRQLSACRFKMVDSNGKVQLEPKAKTKQMLGRSPDRADAFVYGVWTSQFVTPDKHNFSENRIKMFEHTNEGYGWQTAQNDLIGA